MMNAMKPPTREMIEGPEAFTLFRDAMKKILCVPKSALPPSPYKPHTKKKKRITPKGRQKI
jgi:hypothetical protein